jgi:hypothetical protein
MATTSFLQTRTESHRVAAPSRYVPDLTSPAKRH